jgi:predicted transcriptional regulator
MKRTKREKLEQAGFAVSDAQEFLELSDAEMAMIDARVALAQALRHRRSRELKISQTAFAAKVGSSQSRVAKMEAGDPSVSLDLLIRSLVKSGASLEEVARVLAAA